MLSSLDSPTQDADETSPANAELASGAHRLGDDVRTARFLMAAAPRGDDETALERWFYDVATYFTETYNLVVPSLRELLGPPPAVANADARATDAIGAMPASDTHNR